MPICGVRLATTYFLQQSMSREHEEGRAGLAMIVEISWQSHASLPVVYREKRSEIQELQLLFISPFELCGSFEL